MKKFKSFITEDVNLSPEEIDNILRNVYDFHSEYTLKNNKVVTKASMYLSNILYYKILPIQIYSCNIFSIKSSKIESMYGFPNKASHIIVANGVNIKKLDFADIITNTFKIDNNTSIEKIFNINNDKLTSIQIDDTHNLEYFSIDKCSSECTIWIMGCNKIDLKNILIKNKINHFSFGSTNPKFINFNDCNIKSNVGDFNLCSTLTSLDGFDTLEIENVYLKHMNPHVKNLSNLITSKTNIKIITFDNRDKSIDSNVLSKLVKHYVSFSNKEDYIMDFTVALIDAGFEDQV